MNVNIKCNLKCGTGDSLAQMTDKEPSSVHAYVYVMNLCKLQPCFVIKYNFYFYF